MTDSLILSPVYDKTDLDIKKLAEEIYRDKVLRAREQDPCEKLMDGFRMFESALALTKAGVAAELVTTNEAAVMKGVAKRFERVRKVRESGLYKPVSERPVK